MIDPSGPVNEHAVDSVSDQLTQEFHIRIAMLMDLLMIPGTDPLISWNANGNIFILMEALHKVHLVIRPCIRLCVSIAHFEYYIRIPNILILYHRQLKIIVK